MSSDSVQLSHEEDFLPFRLSSSAREFSPSYSTSASPNFISSFHSSCPQERESVSPSPGSPAPPSGGAQPNVGCYAPSGQLYMSGFNFQPNSPYHRGASSLPAAAPVFPEPGLKPHVLSSIKKGARSCPDLASCRSAWVTQLRKLESLGADATFVSEMLSHVTVGVTPGLSARPARASFPNSRSVDSHKTIVRQQLDEFVANRFISSLSAPPPLWHPLLVVTKPGKNPRVCLDLSRNFNELVAKRKFKLLSLEAAVAWSEPGCFYGKMDLSSCFLSFPMHPDAAKDLTFKFGDEFFQFDSMPFGLSSAPRIASSLLDIVSAQLHDEGMRVIRYLDDFLFVCKSERAALICMERAARVLHDYGFKISTSKTEGPSQSLDFLGIHLDSVQQSVSVTSVKLQETREFLGEFLSKRSASRSSLLSLLGKLSFLTSVLPAARPFLRFIIDAAHSTHKRLQEGFRSDLSFWLQFLHSWNGSRKWHAQSKPIVVASDASLEGFAWVVESGPFQHSDLPPPLRTGSATWGTWDGPFEHCSTSSSFIQEAELFSPVAFALEAGEALRDSHVVFVLDNEADVAILNRRKTKDPRLLALLRLLASASAEKNFAFTAIHRYGALNILPDVLSRSSKHGFAKDPASVSLERVNAVVSEEVEKGASAPPSTHPLAHAHFGSFFLSDHVSLAAASFPVHYPNSLRFCSSSSWPWTEQIKGG